MTFSNSSPAMAGLSVVLKPVPTEQTCMPLSQWLSSFEPAPIWIPLTKQKGITKAMPVLSKPDSYVHLLQSICQQITQSTSIEWQGKHYDIGGVEIEPNELYHIRLILDSEAPLKTFIGRAVHALLFSWISAAEPALAEKFHSQAISPFSIAINRVSATRFQLYVTTLQKSLLAPLLWGMSQDLGSSIKVAQMPCRLNSKVAIVESNSFNQLTQLQSKESTVTLEFLSPTSFKQDQHIQPFPLAHSVFGSLLKRWNTFAPESLAFPKIQWNGWVAAYDLKTRAIRMEGGPQIGSVGWVKYHFPDPEQARIANILAHFAYFAGVGRKTTMGMGQTRLRQSPSKP